MASSNGKPNYSRRFFWLAVFIVLLFGGYSAVWYYVAGALEKFAGTAIAEFNKGKRTTMPDRHSGEGIFFTSRVMDLFEIESHHLRFSHQEYCRLGHVCMPFWIL